ncbi:osmoprotectant transport system permease protein [Actinopolyspora xinjiangensis]|uniref:Osmoprotectant transport system permease protein n=1 Tax=Actinopolyspora xinjiangensis TaxID=405564 RepID=A0A1H0UYK5_9ACTN|nr:ABC transporter permease [Actinopolyspora xinjiangensis]SDP71155.1 osmoprotectant transport system permease protein [Actinopolyspora xinjiangensis]
MIDELVRYLSSPSNREVLLEQLGQHVYLALVPLIAGVSLALPLGRLAQRVRWLRGALLGTAGVVYTIPSLAVFVLLPGIIGTGYTSPVNIVIALTLYTTALLVRPVVDALESVPTHVTVAATAMGYRPHRRFLAVELPLAVPALTSAVRVASVSNISLVSVGALVGSGGLGRLFMVGFERPDLVQIPVGIVLTVLLALLVDLLLVVGWRSLTPWERAGRAVIGS